MRSLLVLFVAVAFFATGEALKCYTCSSPQSECNDDFKSSGTGVIETDCPPIYNFCLKSSITMSNGTVAVLRSCSAQYPKAVGRAAAANVTLVSQSMNWCDSDLCNGVSSTSAGLFTLIVLAVPLVFANYH